MVSKQKKFIDFNEIKKIVNIENETLFSVYLNQKYKELSNRNEENKNKGIMKIIFCNYLRLPIFISEKIFMIIDENKDGFLSLEEFIYGMNKLYNGNYKDTIKLVFDILDFNYDGFIEKDDVRMILCLLPLKTDKLKMVYKYQMESLAEIGEIINSTFGKNKKLNFEEFKNVVEKHESNIFIQIICFIYQKKPFPENNINNCFLCEFDCYKEPVISGFNGMVRYQNKLVPKENDLNENDDEDVDENKDKNFKKFITNSDLVYNSPCILLKKNKENNKKYLGYSPSHIFKNNATKKNIQKFSLNEVKNDEKITYENYIYKINASDRTKKYYLVLINKDIYYYVDENKTELKGMHNLSGCFIKENETKMLDNKIYYRFDLVCPSKERSYYFDSKEIYDNFIQKIKEVFGYLNFFDYYEMIDDLAEGMFWNVKLGVEKETKERVAIKIINKYQAIRSNIELVKTEIDIMKLCHHPNVVSLIDHFENAEYIFIVMEYIKGGRLIDYMKEKKFNFTENRAAELIYEIATGVKYLHKYGIVHGGLKPDNIMLTEANDEGHIKIIDFGLCKYLKKKEKDIDGFNILNFVSPEILIRRPFDEEIDIWSIGVILYLMISGELPFDDGKNIEQKTAESIVYDEVKFSSNKFNNKSKEVIELIKKCLTKNPKDRIKIDDIIKSEWIKKNLAPKV